MDTSPENGAAASSAADADSHATADADNGVAANAGSGASSSTTTNPAVGNPSPRDVARTTRAALFKDARDANEEWAESFDCDDSTGTLTCRCKKYRIVLMDDYAWRYNAQKHATDKCQFKPSDATDGEGVASSSSAERQMTDYFKVGYHAKNVITRLLLTIFCCVFCQYTKPQQAQ